MLIALISGLGMFLGDVFQALYVLMLSRGRAGLAGAFDGLTDLTSVISLGGGVTNTYHHAIDLDTYATFAALFVGSVAGALLGDRLSDTIAKGKP